MRRSTLPIIFTVVCLFPAIVCFGKPLTCPELLTSQTLGSLKVGVGDFIDPSYIQVDSNSSSQKGWNDVSNAIVGKSPWPFFTNLKFQWRTPGQPDDFYSFRTLKISAMPKRFRRFAQSLVQQMGPDGLGLHL